MAGEFELHELLAGPILAANAAQADVALGFVDQLQQVAFAPRSAKDIAAGAGPQTLRALSFAAPGGLDADGRAVQQEISVPLLQLVPLSSLQIDTATIEFNCDVAAAKPAGRPAALQPGRGKPAQPMAVPPRLLGRITPTSGADSTGAGNLRVQMHLKRTDLPAGYLDMIAATHSTARQMAAQPEPETPAGLLSARYTGPAPVDFRPGREVRFEILIARVNHANDAPIEIAIESRVPAGFAVIEPAAPVQLTAPEMKIQVVAYVRKEFAMPRDGAAVPILLTGEQRQPNASTATSQTIVKVPISNRSKP